MRISKGEFRVRQQILRRRLGETGVDALCVGASAQIDTRGGLRYLTGYYVPVFEEYLVVPREGPVTLFVHDGCGADFAKNFCAVDDVVILPEREYATDPAKCVTSFLNCIGCKTVGTAWSRSISSSFYLSFLRHANMKTRDLNPVVEDMRSVKSPAEISLMREAVKFNEEVLDFYLKKVAVGDNELDAVKAASAFALQGGAEDLYWMASTAGIPTMAFLAAAKSQPRNWQRGDYHYIVLEHSTGEGYFSEITQLISFGAPKKAYVDAYAAVTAAQKAAFSAIAPGVPVSRLADAAQEVLCGCGYCQKAEISPCIGHSQGLDAWELPRISDDDPTIIRPGMRFNIHPAVTLNDGAKITSCISCLSTDDGAEILSSLPEEIIVL